MTLIIGFDPLDQLLEIFLGLRFHIGLKVMIIFTKLCYNEIYKSIKLFSWLFLFIYYS